MRRRPVALLAVCTALVACGGGAGEDPPAVRETATPQDAVPTPGEEARALEGGVVSVRISAAADQLLDFAGVRLSTTGDGAHGARELTFPIRSGRLSVTPPGGRIELGGGLRLSARGDHVDATDLRLLPDQEVVTAVVRTRRVPLLRFKLQYPKALPAAGSPFTAQGSVSVVGDRALEQLGTDFGVEVLQQGLPLGTMRLTAR